MYELQAYSPQRGRWMVCKLARTEAGCCQFRQERVNPAWQTRIVKATWPTEG